MAALSLTNAEIVRAVLQEMGYGRDPADMDAATEADVRHIIRAGLKRFYFPTVGEYAYQWRWREKHQAVSAVATQATGTLAVAAGTATLTDGTWPADLTDYFIRVSGHVLFVTARTSDTTATLSNTQLAVDAGAEYEASRFRYSLPADFAEWLGGVVYADGNENRLLAGSSEAEIRLRYAVGQGRNSQTTHYAITSAPNADALRILFWPVPEPDAFIQGVYLSVPEDNLPASLLAPGVTVQVAPVYAECVMEAILAAAEAYHGDTVGLHEARFQAALGAAIAHDKAVGGSYDFSHRTSDPRRHGNVLPIDFSSQL